MILGRTRLLLTAVSMVMLWGTAPWSRSTAETADPTKVVVKDFMFMPTPLTVKAGSTVTWTNMDDEPHTVVSDTGLFKSGGMDTNESFHSSSISPALTNSIVRFTREWSER